MPKVSVVIPCYNQGQYIAEAVNSVLSQTFQNFEVIIVNDGSNDIFTDKLLHKFNHPKIQIIHTTNYGLSAARNNGIQISKGEYILPLDADDKISPVYLEQAVKILDENIYMGIVYSKAEFFGNKSGTWDLGDYNFPDILVGNMIFCSALFRRSDWEIVGGYKPIMKYGWEDYEFWLSLIELGREVYQIPEVLFYYRQKDYSMLNTMQEEKWLYSYEQLFLNHKELYSKHIRRLFKEHIELGKYKELLYDKQRIEQELDAIKKSNSYQIGKIITLPFRICYLIFRKLVR